MLLGEEGRELADEGREREQLGEEGRELLRRGGWLGPLLPLGVGVGWGGVGGPCPR